MSQVKHVTIMSQIKHVTNFFLFIFKQETIFCEQFFVNFIFYVHVEKKMYITMTINTSEKNPLYRNYFRIVFK